MDIFRRVLRTIYSIFLRRERGGDGEEEGRRFDTDYYKAPSAGEAKVGLHVKTGLGTTKRITFGVGRYW